MVDSLVVLSQVGKSTVCLITLYCIILPADLQDYGSVLSQLLLGEDYFLVGLLRMQFKS